MKISELRKRSNAFVANLPNLISQIVTDNEDLEDLNKQQLLSSKLANDRNIKPYYSPSYANWKRSAYPSSYGSGLPNMFLTGDLFKNMEIGMAGKGYEIKSMLPYVPKLERKYSGLIFGIAPSNRNKAYAITTPLLRQRYKQATGL